jgi:hypothetical protein
MWALFLGGAAPDTAAAAAFTLDLERCGDLESLGYIVGMCASFARRAGLSS